MKWLLLLSVFLASTVTAQTIYKVVQADGTILYTDTPQEGASQVELLGNTSNVADSLPTPKIKPQTTEKPSPRYKVTITSPEPEATIRNNQGNVTITASTTPSFRGRYRLTFDGQSTRINSAGNFTLTGLNRGTHTYHIDILDNKGKTLASSPSQTLYLHQASALINTN